MKINEIIELSPAFSAEVNVQRDFRYQLSESNKYVDGYLPNSSSRYIMSQIIDSLSIRDSKKIHLITASYGTGKSYLLLILAYLLANNEVTYFTELKRKIEDKEDSYGDGLSKILANYWSAGSKYLVIIPGYGTDNFDQALLSALNDALKKSDLNYLPKTYYLRAAETLENWEKDGNILFAQFEERITGKSGLDCIRLLKACDSSTYESFKSIFKEIVSSDFSETHGDIYQAFSDTAQHITQFGYQGIVILHDEFGGVLDKIINKTSQSSSLMIQEFLENIKRKTGNTNIIFIAASHQDPATIQIDKKQDIEKIIGRFEKHPLEIGDAESEELMGKVFWSRDQAAKSALLQEDVLEELLDEILELELYPAKPDKWVQEVIIKALYPLHPLTSFVLPRLSNQFAQNTRSMFNFLSPKEIRTGSLKHFLENTDGLDSNGKLNLFTPDMLLGFFEQNLIDARSENVSSLVDAFQTSLGKVADPVVKKLMENILVLTATRKKQVRPTIDVLAWAMSDLHLNDLRELLNHLVQTEILELNPNDQTYEFPAFGSKSLSKIIQDEKNNIGVISLSQYRTMWTEIRGPEAYLFDEHNDTFGSNRSFRILWIVSPNELEEQLEALSKSYSWESKDGQIQGYIVYLLTNDENDLEAYQSKISKFSAVSKYLVFAQASETTVFDGIKKVSFDYTAFLRASKNIEVTANANHMQRVRGELIRLHSELTSQIKNLFEPINWLWSFSKLDEGVEIKSPRAFDNRMDSYINEIFTIVPKVKDYVLWFSNKSKTDIKSALSEILTAKKDSIPLVNHNTSGPVPRIINNFFISLKLTKETSTSNKIHYGEIKIPETGSPAEAIFKLLDRTLKVGELVPPSAFVKPLLQAPFGLSETLIKLIFTCYLRANRENLLIVDPKRPAYSFEKDPGTIEDMFKGGANYAIRKIEMSTFEIKYLRQLNSLFNKDTYANDFGELSKRFDGIISFLSPLQWELIKQKEEYNKFYGDLLKPFLENAAEASVDREKVSREFFMVTLPGFFLQISTKEEFENDPDHITTIISHLRIIKDYPSIRELAFKQEVILNLSNNVFKSSISTIDGFRNVVKEWFNSLSYAAKNLSVFEDPQITAWIRKMRSSETIDVAKFYLDELAEPAIKDWTNLPYQQVAFLNTIDKFKKEIESYTGSPLIVYKRIALTCFSMSANECATELIFTDTFKSWWENLPELSKAPHYEDQLTNIFVEEFNRSFSVKDKFLNYIPARWLEAGYSGIINPNWEHWSEMEIRSIADTYGTCTMEIMAWQPPIAEDTFAVEISSLFDLVSVNTFDDLQQKLLKDWFDKLPANTRIAHWTPGGINEKFLLAVKSSQCRDFFINVFPALCGLKEFKYWNKDILGNSLLTLTQVKSEIEGYKRPLMDLVRELENRIKKKSSSITEFRVQFKENLQSTEAYRASAELEPDLLSDSRAIPLLKQVRKLTSDEELLKFVEIMAKEFGIIEDYYLWSADDQKKFCKDLQDVYAYVQKWKYPQDTGMHDAKSKISDAVVEIQKSFDLSTSQLLKILRDLIEEKSETSI